MQQHPSTLLALLLWLMTSRAKAEARYKYLLVSIDDDETGNNRVMTSGPDWRERANQAAEVRGAFDPVQTEWRKRMTRSNRSWLNAGTAFSTTDETCFC